MNQESGSILFPRRYLTPAWRGTKLDAEIAQLTDEKKKYSADNFQHSCFIESFSGIFCSNSYETYHPSVAIFPMTHLERGLPVGISARSRFQKAGLGVDQGSWSHLLFCFCFLTGM